MKITENTQNSEIKLVRQCLGGFVGSYIPNNKLKCRKVAKQQQKEQRYNNDGNGI